MREKSPEVHIPVVKFRCDIFPICYPSRKSTLKKIVAVIDVIVF
jgi:hypothetical protein